MPANQMGTLGVEDVLTLNIGKQIFTLGIKRIISIIML